MRTTIISLLLVSSLVACGGGGAGKGAKSSKLTPPAWPPPGDNALPEMPGVVTCYEGLATLKIPSGDAPAAYIVRVGWDAEKKTVTEDAVLWVNNQGLRTWFVTTAVSDEMLTVEGKTGAGDMIGGGKIILGGTPAGTIWNSWYVETWMGSVSGDPAVKSTYLLVDNKYSVRSDTATMTVLLDLPKISDADCQRIFSSFPPM